MELKQKQSLEQIKENWDILKIELEPEEYEGNLSRREIWQKNFSIILLQRRAGKNAVGMVE